VYLGVHISDSKPVINNSAEPRHERHYTSKCKNCSSQVQVQDALWQAPRNTGVVFGVESCLGFWRATRTCGYSAFWFLRTERKRDQASWYVQSVPHVQRKQIRVFCQVHDGFNNQGKTTMFCFCPAQVIFCCILVSRVAPSLAIGVASSSAVSVGLWVVARWGLGVGCWYCSCYCRRCSGVVLLLTRSNPVRRQRWGRWVPRAPNAPSLVASLVWSTYILCTCCISQLEHLG
jgi:hypothetical protein